MKKYIVLLLFLLALANASFAQSTIRAGGSQFSEFTSLVKLNTINQDTSVQNIVARLGSGELVLIPRSKLVSSGGGGIAVESDPVFNTSVAATIMAQDVTNWDEIYANGWRNGQLFLRINESRRELAFGRGAGIAIDDASFTRSILLGDSTAFLGAGGENVFAIGHGAFRNSLQVNNSFAFGINAGQNNNFANVFLIGNGAVANRTGEIVVGSSSYNRVRLGAQEIWASGLFPIDSNSLTVLVPTSINNEQRFSARSLASFLDRKTIITDGAFGTKFRVDTLFMSTRNYVNTRGFLTTEVDGNVSNEGRLSVVNIATNEVQIASNTPLSSQVNIVGVGGISVTGNETSDDIFIQEADPKFNDTNINISQIGGKLTTRGKLEVDDVPYSSSGIVNKILFVDNAGNVVHKPKNEVTIFQDVLLSFSFPDFRAQLVNSGGQLSGVTLDQLVSQTPDSSVNILTVDAAEGRLYVPKPIELDTLAISRLLDTAAAIRADFPTSFEFDGYIKQDTANYAFTLENNIDSSSWRIGVGETTKNFRFDFKRVGNAAYSSKSQIANQDGSFIRLSQLSFKHNVLNLSDCTESVMRLRPVSFQYFDSEQYNLGLIADEVEEVYPNMIRRMEDNSKALNYDDVTILLLKTVQEQQKVIEDLKQKVEKLEQSKKQ